LNLYELSYMFFFFSSRRRHTRFSRDWSSDVCSSDLGLPASSLPLAELADKPLTQLLSESGMVASGKQAKDALGRAAVLINGKACSLEDNNRAQACFSAQNAYFGRYFLARVGKKKYHLFEVN